MNQVPKPWTYKIVIAYEACKQCGYIIECRRDFEKTNGEYVRKLTCPRCSHQFEVKTSKTPTPY